MIYEAYCSYEVSKLLKEKGFDECIFEFYVSDSIMYARNGEGFRLSELPDIYYPHITHQMACAWLREVHKLHIAILWDCGACIGKNSFCYHIYRIDNYEDRGYNKIGFDSNEEAVEAALKYTLNNLL